MRAQKLFEANLKKLVMLYLAIFINQTLFDVKGNTFWYMGRFI